MKKIPNELNMLHRVIMKKNIPVEEVVRRAYFYAEVPLNITKLTTILKEIKEMFVREIVVDYCIYVLANRVEELPKKLLEGKS